MTLPPDVLFIGVFLLLIAGALGSCAHQLGRMADALSAMNQRESGPINTQWELSRIARALAERQQARGGWGLHERDV
jgi:hypothetical protein